MVYFNITKRLMDPWIQGQCSLIAVGIILKITVLRLLTKHKNSCIMIYLQDEKVFMSTVL